MRRCGTCLLAPFVQFIDRLSLNCTFIYREPEKKNFIFRNFTRSTENRNKNGKRYLRFDVGDLLPIDQDIVQGVGRLDDQRQDRYERENQHLQQLNSTSAAVSRIRGTCPAGFLSVRLGRRDIVRRETPHRAHFRHARAITR